MFTRVTNKRTRDLFKKAKRFYETQRLHIYDQGSKNSISGIKATVFGGSSALGAAIGTRLTQMGSVCVYPHRNVGDQSNLVFRELRANADLGYKTAIRLMDFTDQKEVDVTLKHSNVVISAIGSRRFYSSQQDFDDANINVPVTIAKAVRDNPEIKRFIYISAAGADPNSSSRMLRKNWLGEQKVREIYPDVTVLRPTTMFNTFDPNNSPQGKWTYMLKAFNRTFFRIKGANGLVQPVHFTDVSLAAFNCIKMEETIGQAYDLGGRHIYTWDEIYEQFFNVSGVKPYVIPIPLETAMEWMNSPRLSNFYRYAGKYWLYPEILMNETIDIVANPDEKGFDDLNIVPVAFGSNVKEYVNDILWYNTGAADTSGQAYNG
jgi:uncharacterized protein YbjT (DUF2867 family)